MDIRHLVKAVSDELQKLLPAGVNVHEVEAQLVVKTPVGVNFLMLGQNVLVRLSEGEAEHEAISGALLEMLGELQDVVTEFLTVPWPQARTDRFGFLEPHVDIRDGVLYLWYGDSEQFPAAPVASVRLS